MMSATRTLPITFLLLLFPSLASAGDTRIETARKALVEHLQRDKHQVFLLKDLVPVQEDKLTALRALIMSAADIRGYKGDQALDEWLNKYFRYNLSKPQPKGLQPRKVRSHWQVAKRARRFHTLPNCKQMKFFVAGAADFAKIPEKNIDAKGCVTRIKVVQGKLDGEKRPGLYAVPFLVVTYNSVLRLSGRGYLHRFDVVLDASGKVVLILKTTLTMLWMS